MDIPGDFPTILSQLWAWVVKNREWLFSGAGIIGVVAIIGWLRTKLHSPKHPPTSAPSVTIQNNDPAVAKAIAALSRQLDAKDRQLEVLSQQLADARQGEKAAIREAITALPKQTEIPDAQARIEEALAAAADGNTTLAEAIFSEVEARKVTEGKAAYQAAAEAARHRGALAFLHDTDKAIAAYRRATELDPENAVGWNRLGRLLYRTGALDDAEAAYRKVESLGKAQNNRALLAIAYGNLGNLYQTRGDPDQAEAMYRKSLAIDEELGAQRGHGQ